MNGIKERGVCIIIACAVVYVMAVSFFFGITHIIDSGKFIATAQHLVQGHGFYYDDGKPLTAWAPLYPLLLSVCFLLKMPVTVSVVAINSMALCFSLFFVYKLLRQWIDVAWIRLTILAGIAVGYSLLEAHVTASTEAVFTALLLGFVYFLGKYGEGQRRRDFLILSGCVMLACLQRYAGLSLVVTGVVFFLFMHHQTWVAKLKTIMGFVAITLTPLALWMIRNFALDQTLSGGRSQDIVAHAVSWPNLVTSMYYGLHKMSTWFMPHQLWEPGRLWIMVLVLLVLLFWMTRRGLPSSWKATSLTLCVYFVFLVMYTMLYVPIGYYINDRLLAPAYPLGMMVLGYGVYHVSRKQGWMKSVVVLLIGVCCYNFARTVKNTIEYKQNQSHHMVVWK